MANCCTHQEDNWAGTDLHLFPPFFRFFIINIFLVTKMKSGRYWTRLASYPLQYGNWPWWNNPPLCKAYARLHLHEENGTGQCPEPQERDFTVGVKIRKNSRESKNFRIIIFPDNFRCILRLQEGLVFSLLSPTQQFRSEKYRLTWDGNWDGKCKKFSVLFSLTQAQRGYSGFQVTGMIAMGAKIKTQKNPLDLQTTPQKSLDQNLSPNKSHAKFPSHNKNFCIKWFNTPLETLV